jgi:hypothetical protein
MAKLTNKDALKQIYADINSEVEEDLPVLTTARKTQREKTLDKIKRDAKNDLSMSEFGVPYSQATLKQKALFASKFFYDKKRKSYYKRKKKLDAKKIFLTLKKRSKIMKRLGKKIGKKSHMHSDATVSDTVTRVQASIVKASPPAIIGMSMEIDDASDPETVVGMIFAKAKRKNLSPEAMNTLDAYYSRPQNITAYQIGKEPVIFVTEGDGMYFVEGSPSIVKKIESAVRKYLKSFGVSPRIEILTYKEDPDHITKVSEILNSL